jgi:hypothetical protein
MVQTLKLIFPYSLLLMFNSIEKRQLENIATWMIPVQPTNLPTVLRGVFFLDGNPLPDDCINMYNIAWDSKNFSLMLPVFTALQWTFHRSILGWLLLLSVKLMQLKYQLQFTDETLQQAQVIPWVLGVRIPEWIIDARLCRAENSDNGDIWYRKNSWFGGISHIGEYTLRRVVDEHGAYTPAFQDMLTKAPNECLVVGRN